MGELTDDQVRALLDGATPGPWHYIARPNGTIVILIRDEHGNPSRHIAEMSWADVEGGLPDARLMAAAPDLARALIDARAERDAAVELAEERLRGQHRLSNQLNDTARDLNAELAASRAREAGALERAAGAIHKALDIITSGSFDASDPRIDALDDEADRYLAEAAALAPAKTEPPDDGWTWNEGLHKWLPPMGEAG